MAVVLWLLLALYTAYDWWVYGTWWRPWTFAAATVAYAVWWYWRVCRVMAAQHLQDLIGRLRARRAPAGREDFLNVLAWCLLTPTGRCLVKHLTLASHTARGMGEYNSDAAAVLSAYVAGNRNGEPVDLDAATLRWLK